MRPCLLQVDAIAGTIERHLALFPAALRANSPVNRWTKALFFPGLANRARHYRSLLLHYDTPQQARLPVRRNPQRLSKACFQGAFGSQTPGEAVFTPISLCYPTTHRKTCAQSGIV